MADEMEVSEDIFVMEMGELWGRNPTPDFYVAITMLQNCFPHMSESETYGFIRAFVGSDLHRCIELIADAKQTTLNAISETIVKLSKNDNRPRSLKDIVPGSYNDAITSGLEQSVDV